MTPAKEARSRVARSTAGEGHHGLAERIAAIHDLPPSERIVSRFFSEHRDEIPFLSAGEIALAAGVGSATVIRTAQRLGYDGLLDLKRELRNGLRSGGIPTPSPSRAPGTRGPEAGSILEEVVAIQGALLAALPRSVPRDDFEFAVDLITRSERIAMFVGGTYAGLAQYFGRLLRRDGRRVLLVDTPDVSEVLAEFGPGYVLVAFAHEVVSDRLSTMLDIAHSADVPVILVTDILALALKGRYAVALSTGSATRAGVSDGGRRVGDHRSPADRPSRA